MFVPNKQTVTRLDYCQYLLSSQINDTLTNFADHSSQQFSHDQLNRFLRDDKLKPRLVWEQVKDSIVMSENGSLLFETQLPIKIIRTRLNWCGVSIRAMPTRSSKVLGLSPVFMLILKPTSFG